MSQFSIGRLLGPGLARPLSKTPCPAASAPQWARLFSQSHAARNTQPGPPPPPRPTALLNSNMSSGGEVMSRLAKGVIKNAIRPSAAGSGDLGQSLDFPESSEPEEPYHFHIFSHKHNTHITLTKPNRDALLSLSCGNIGFKKSGRKHYDSAYQLGAYVIDKMHQQGLVSKIQSMEVVLRGFGPGREAVVKVLMGNEGKILRGKITRVSDSTRLKFGGTRSPRKRRLG
ncbi:translational machinery component [Trichocladium antarcticum]|uniref:Small ribosomal subunit protein uS11m n=1 Tax=Trichocladium antarcticum TaxID=1450529 RepID=A0AAN6UPY3_9PEZI|nr:translational machinery component [Trichocladium antarcticum]